MERRRFISDCVTKAAEELGYPTMKMEQLDVAIAFVEGRDVFAILPTGFGKSLCYACLPASFDRMLEQDQGYSIVVVVTPLLAIMKDQAATFSHKGLTATCITGEVNDVTGVTTGKYQLVFITPEKLINSNQWRKIIQTDVYTERLKALVIDEAHCVKKWGETFRCVLARIGEVRSLIPSTVHVMALTATATRSVQIAVTNIVGLRNPFVIARCPARSNLIYSVGFFKSLPDTFEKFASKLKCEKTNFPKTIIYVRSFGLCADIFLYLKNQLGQAFIYPEDAPDIPEFRLVEVFTSVTESNHKSEILHLFKVDSNLRVVVATLAFGMGIDCPNVRQVIHVGLPDDVSSYIQETGRAGRDGKPSMVTLLHSRTYHKVEEDIKHYIQNTTECRRDFLFRDMDNYAHEDMGFKCLCCDVCAKLCSCGKCKEMLLNQSFYLCN